MCTSFSPVNEQVIEKISYVKVGPFVKILKNMLKIVKFGHRN